MFPFLSSIQHHYVVFELNYGPFTQEFIFHFFLDPPVASL